MRLALAIVLVGSAFVGGFVACVGDDPQTSLVSDAGTTDSSNLPDSTAQNEGGGDASADASADAADAAVACGPEREFKVSKHLAELDGDGGPVQWVSLLPDESTVYFVRANSQAFVANRDGGVGPFGPSTVVGSKVSEISVAPTLLAERLVQSPVTYEVNLFARDPITQWNSGTGFTSSVPDHIQGSISADSLQMVAWNQSPNGGDDKLKRLARGALGSSFGSLGDALDVSQAGMDSTPVLSGDALTLIFSRAGNYLYATRTSRTTAFTVRGPLLLAPTLVPLGAFYPPRWVSPDFCRLYVTTPNQGALVLSQ